ncbi:MAG TPA: SIMPL domain-containing protein [Vicinamibacterales bacterium]|nr:SIMPL domain-containing protein [Vicinamibacterales bacterium]
MRMPYLVLPIALSVASLARAQALPPGPPVVVVQGEGVLRMAPDQAFVRIGAESRSRNPRDAQSANAEAMTGVQQRVAAAGVPRDAIRTLAVALQQEFDYADGRQTLRGYVARNVVEVRVDELSRLAAVLDASVGAGATSIQALRFEVKQRAEVERDALAQAVADALARAEAAARGAGRTVDRVVRIEEAGAPSVARPQAMEMARMAADAAPATPVAEGEIEIRARVTVTAALK